MTKNEGVTLKLTAAVVIDGELLAAGALVEVSDAEARNLLHRERAVLATEADESQAKAAAARPAKGKAPA